VQNRWVPVACIITLGAAFVIDLFTPQLFVAAILLDIPIVLSSLGGGSRRFTYGMVVAALAANALAGYVNGVQEHYHWDVIGLGDRALAALSIVLVGYLVTVVQESAQRAGRFASMEARARREADIAAAMERIRAFLSTDLVLRALAHEALALLEAGQTRFVLARPQREILVAHAGTRTVEIEDAPPFPEEVSLAQRAFDLGDVVAVRRSDALGRMILDRYDAPALLALPIVERDERFGVLLVPLRDETRLDEAIVVARAFARQAATALANARLFEQLAERNDALSERNAVIRDLVYAVSHDLRTPLAALAMTLRQAQAGTYGELPERYRGIVDASVAAIDDLQRFAETLLLVARIESGERVPQRDLVDLGELAAQIADELDALARTRQVQLDVSSGETVRAVADRGDVRRAIVNLVANAVEHTPEGGRVQIDVARSGANALVRVRDTGYGVSDAARPQLFSRFARGDGRRGGGSGLGLYIVRLVAEESGGSVGYEPNVPRGSIFTLRLPLAR
jgi:signal transduction histidine kinase